MHPGAGKLSFSVHFAYADIISVQNLFHQNVHVQELVTDQKYVYMIQNMVKNLCFAYANDIQRPEALGPLPGLEKRPLRA